ncbi:hypothetical protein O181_000311 [Austropuccinia psidii MF-1]|uniref:Uncharacterized protein n=1 Tax=Austropuccinia psidii MF-1 TaxID=1389203 RepID=A0A9Q3B8T4_9BASI|nr:hypothetical protein [Austropuccinia psidii MF-1]
MPLNQEQLMPVRQEKMSPNHSETNDEPRRDHFMVDEKGIQSNGWFTHPQMPITQSMLEKYKIRKQRNKEPKAQNMKKCASQKEKERWLQVELPENVHGMRSAVHSHFLFLLKVRDKDFFSLPAPPSTEEREIAIQVAGHLGYLPDDVFNEPLTQVQSQGFQSYCESELHKLGLNKFIWDSESSWKHPFSNFMSIVLYLTFHLALVSTDYHHYCWKKDFNNYMVVAALMEQYFTYSKREWKSIQKDAEYLVKKENQKLTNIC